jgi:hypothetical protein
VRDHQTPWFKKLALKLILVKFVKIYSETNISQMFNPNTGAPPIPPFPFPPIGLQGPLPGFPNPFMGMPMPTPPPLISKF